MKLVDMTLKEYLEVLRSNAPAPGGGSAAALEGAQSAALVSMVIGLTLGREKYKEFEEDLKKVEEKISRIYLELLNSIDLDTEAFNKVSAAYKMPKETEEEKSERSKAIRVANVGATEVPYHTVELCLEGLKVMTEMEGKFNTNAASDLGVAALGFLAGAKSAWLNVKINLPGIKDEVLKADFEKAINLVKEAEMIANNIYDKVEGEL